MTGQIFVGVDVAKDWLGIHHSSHGPWAQSGQRPYLR